MPGVLKAHEARLIQNTIFVEHWRRSSAALWTVKKHTRRAGTIRLQTHRVALPLTEIYRETNV